MPRIAKPTSPESNLIRQALAQYIKRSGKSVNSFAIVHGIEQPTLSRFLSGRTKTVTPGIRELLDSLHNFSILRISEAHNARLAAAVGRACAMNPRLSDELAALIDAIVDASNSDASPPKATS
jgi:orotidine-5'-phosphate decarboxylase